MNKLYSALAIAFVMAGAANATDYLTVGETRIDVDNIDNIKYAAGANGYETAVVTLKNGDSEHIALADGTVVDFEHYEITWAALQWIVGDGTISTGDRLDAGACVFVNGITNATEAAIDAQGIEAQLGWSGTSTDPASDDYVWTDIAFAGDWGDNFYFQGKSAETFAAAGDYYYAIRFRMGENDKWFYATDPAGEANYSTFSVAENTGQQDYVVTWACLTDWYSVWNDNGTQLFETTVEVFADGLTNSGSKPEGIQVQIGISLTDSDPRGEEWTWSEDCWAQWENGNNYVYQGRVVLAEKGTYYYVVRARYGEDAEWVYGGSGGVWNGNDSVAKTFTWE